jgi:hypothetical protein
VEISDCHNNFFSISNSVDLAQKILAEGEEQRKRSAAEKQASRLLISVPELSTSSTSKLANVAATSATTSGKATTTVIESSGPPTVVGALAERNARQVSSATNKEVSSSTTATTGSTPPVGTGPVHGQSRRPKIGHAAATVKEEEEDDGTVAEREVEEMRKKQEQRMADLRARISIKNRHAEPGHRLTRLDIERLADAGLLSLEHDPGEVAPFHLQGNIDMYTDQVLLLRDEVKYHPDLLSVVKLVRSRSFTHQLLANFTNMYHSGGILL